MRVPSLPRSRDAAWPIAIAGTVAILVGIASIYVGAVIPGLPVPLIPVDLSIYVEGSHAAIHHEGLYENSYPSDAGFLPFTYPPFAAIGFWPLSLLGLPAAAALMCALSLASLMLILLLGIRRLDEAYPHALGSSLPTTRRVLLAVLLVFPTEPIWRTLAYGQVNLLLAALVLIDLWGPRWRGRGVLLGIAAAIKLTPAVLALSFLIEGDRRSAARSIAGGVGATLLAWLILPRESTTYWLSTLRHVDRIGESVIPAQQSLRGVVDRLGLSPHLSSVLWGILLCCALVLFGIIALRLSPRRAGKWTPQAHLWAPLLCGLLGLLLSPISWSHHWVWLALVWLVLLSTRRWGWALAYGVLLYARLHFAGEISGLPGALSWVLEADFVLGAIVLAGVAVARGLPAAETTTSPAEVQPPRGNPSPLQERL